MKVDNFQQQLTDDISKIFSQPGAVRLGYSGISDVGKFIHQTVAEAAKSANVAVLGMNDLIFFGYPESSVGLRFSPSPNH